MLYTEPAKRVVAERVAKLVRGRAIYARSLPRDVTANTLFLEGRSKRPSLTAIASQSSRPGGAVVFVYRGDPELLLKTPPIRSVPVRGATLRPAAAVALLAALAAAALLAEHVWSVGVIALVLILVCLRAPRSRRRFYLIGTLLSAGALFVVTPFVETIGSHPVWTGPIIPVLGQLDITREELSSAALNALRLAAVGFAFAAYALLLDHDRVLRSVRFARTAALATRLLPTLERDATGFVESLRGRGIAVTGVRGHARASLASARKLARARAQPRGGDGGAWLRQSGADQRSPAALARAGYRCGRAGGVDRDRGGAVALAHVERLTFAYPGAGSPALHDVSIEIEEGELVAVFGTSGSGKSTLLRALSGLVPHFHGGRFEGRVKVSGSDTRTVRPAELTGTVATVFQDPEEQIVLTHVAREVAFGLENLGTPPNEILPRAHHALATVGALPLVDRPVSELSGGELQRVALASALALRPRLLLLDEPTSQLDPAAAGSFLELVAELGIAVVIAEQRPRRVLEHADRVLFLENGRVLFDAAASRGRGVVRRSSPALARPRRTWSGNDSRRAGLPFA